MHFDFSADVSLYILELRLHLSTIYQSWKVEDVFLQKFRQVILS